MIYIYLPLTEALTLTEKEGMVHYSPLGNSLIRDSVPPLHAYYQVEPSLDNPPFRGGI